MANMSCQITFFKLLLKEGDFLQSCEPIQALGCDSTAEETCLERRFSRSQQTDASKLGFLHFYLRVMFMLLKK